MNSYSMAFFIGVSPMRPLGGFHPEICGLWNLWMGQNPEYDAKKWSPPFHAPTYDRFDRSMVANADRKSVH